jgi:hypothetical protein
MLVVLHNSGIYLPYRPAGAIPETVYPQRLT